MRQITSSRLSLSPAAVIFAALFSLCVSSNVGPCFFPLPVLENYAAENFQQTPDAKASRSHSKGSASFRVPMAQAQKRADRELNAPPLAVMPRIYFALPHNIRVFADSSHPDIYVGGALALLPSGRAPPRLV
jgi:hypothetical protein